MANSILHRRRLWLLSLSSLLTLGACTEQPPPGYPADYRAALATQRGIAPVPAHFVDTFVELFEGNHGPASIARAGVLYAHDVYFSDTLTTTRRHADVVDHFERLERAGTRIVLTVHDRIHHGEDVYVVWSMDAQFRAGRTDIATDTIGVSHLRFNEDGQIVLQQDFWDAAHGFYQHLPVLGTALRRVAGGFQSP